MLTLKFNTCTLGECKGLVFNEITGREDLCNPTGWGTNSSDSNVLISKAVQGTLTIESASLATPVKLILPNYPSIDSCNKVTILAEDIDASWKSIPDGYYRFTYDVLMDDDTVHTVVVHKFFSCNIKCCIDKLLLKITDKPSCGSSEVINDYLQAFSIYQGLLDAACRAEIERFDRLMKTLNKICSLKNCGCGCK